MSATEIRLFEQLVKLVPLGELGPVSLRELAGHTRAHDVAAGNIIFHRGDEDNQTIYLLSGRVLLRSPQQEIVVEGGTASARFPLSGLKPRHFTATALTPARILRIESAVLDSMVVWDQLAQQDLTVLPVSGRAPVTNSSWMVQMLRNRVFLKLPAGYVSALMKRFQPMSVTAGQVIVMQGGPGDYYYIIKSGRARVTRRLRLSEQEVELARLMPGDGFGEEALLSGTARNATVTMATDGVLLRLPRFDFEALLSEPVVKRVEEAEAVALRNKGAIMIDVRYPAEYRHATLRGSVNIPLSELRERGRMLDRGRRYIVFCDSGRRSAAAVYLLLERGVDACMLDGGLAAINRRLEHAAEFRLVNEQLAAVAGQAS